MVTSDLKLPNLSRWRNRSLLVGLVLAGVCILRGIFDPAQFFQAYLFAYLFVLGLPLGGLALVMIGHLAGGAWTLLVRRIFEAEMLTMPLMALLWIPIGAGLPHTYRWASTLVPISDAHQSWQNSYLEPTFFYWRAAAYFALWVVLALLLGEWSRRQDASPDVRILWKCNQLSGVGLAIFGVALHFAAIDWVMSLQTAFTSTIIGPLVFSGQILSAFAAAVVVFCLLADRPDYRDVLSEKVMNDIGSLLFTLLILWAYMVWFQFMLAWIADLPHGTTWYLPRLRNGWQWFAVALALIHFVVPFVFLLFRKVKRDRRLLGGVAAWILFTQLLFDFYQIVPSFPRDGYAISWMYIAAPIGMAGLWTAAFAWQLDRLSLVPGHDVNFSQAQRLRALEDDEIVARRH